MRKICFITGTRADYGIMRRLMQMVKDSSEAELQIIATNMHLSERHGKTINEILNDGFNVNFKIDSDLYGDKPVDTAHSFAVTAEEIADAFKELAPDIGVILGDRYEALAAASVANIFNIPVAHLHGGETTEGAYDDAFRNAITNLSYLHFASAADYSKKIIMMGQPAERVFNVGALGVENVLYADIMPLASLEESIEFALGNDFCIVAFHPETRNPQKGPLQIKNLISSLSDFISDGMKFLVTMPNSDTGSRIIEESFIAWEKENPESVKTIRSLGQKRFFSALAYSKAIIGNSSAAIIEAPVFRVPSVNIGDRQKGRVMGPSIISCKAEKADIYSSISKAIEPSFQFYLNDLSLEGVSPYYKKDSAIKIFRTLIDFPLPCNNIYSLSV